MENIECKVDAFDKSSNKNKKPTRLSGFRGTSSPEASGEPGTHRLYFLDKISSKIEGLAIIFLIKILLFIFLIKFSRKTASSLFWQLKSKANSQSFAIFVKEPA
jgi:hypothetical protein